LKNLIFWKKRFHQFGEYSVGPGDIKNVDDLEKHRQIFLLKVKPWINMLRGPVLDYGCGTGRWVSDLPKPYVGLDLLPEHIKICRDKFKGLKDIKFDLSINLSKLRQDSFSSVFTCTVLQHIVDLKERNNILFNLNRILDAEGEFLSIEWSENQRDYDWCTAVRKEEIEKWFHVKNVGEILENGRKHTIWFGSKRFNIE
jgi:SAM-dependent methyltransferase